MHTSGVNTLPTAVGKSIHSYVLHLIVAASDHKALKIAISPHAAKSVDRELSHHGCQN